MTVVFVADEVDVLGGIQTVIHTLAGRLHARGHRVHIIGLYRGTDPVPSLAADGVEQTILDAPRPDAPPDPAHLRASKRHLQALLTAAGGGTLIMTSVHVTRWLTDVDTSGYRRIGHYHGSFPYARTHYHLQAIRDEWPAFDACVFLSDDDAAAFAAHTTVAAHCIPNPLPSTHLPTLMRRNAAPGSQRPAAGPGGRPPDRDQRLRHRHRGIPPRRPAGLAAAHHRRR